MSSIAKGFIAGMAATAQGYMFFARRQHELIAQMVHELEGPLDNERSVFATADQ